MLRRFRLWVFGVDDSWALLFWPEGNLIDLNLIERQAGENSDAA
jgi:hypothetical protein